MMDPPVSRRRAFVCPCSKIESLPLKLSERSFRSIADLKLHLMRRHYIALYHSIARENKCIALENKCIAPENKRIPCPFIAPENKRIPYPYLAKADPRADICWETILGKVTKNSRTWQLVWEELCEKPLRLSYIGQSLEQLHEEIHRHILEFLDDVFDFLKNLQDELTHFVKLSMLWSEFPCNRRHCCTTMPWTIWPALAVLWGVCWMFIYSPGYGFIDPSLLAIPKQNGAHKTPLPTQQAYGSQPLSSPDFITDARRSQYEDLVNINPECDIHALTASQFPDNTHQVPSAGSTRELEVPTTTASQSSDTATVAATTTTLPFAQTARETPAHESLPPGHSVFPHQAHLSELSPPQSHADSLKCPKCEQNFTRKSSLKRHLKQFHGPPQQQPLFFCPNHKCKRSRSADPSNPFTRQSHVDRHLKTCNPVLNPLQSPSNSPSQPDELPDAGPSQLEVGLQVPLGLQDMQQPEVQPQPQPQQQQQQQRRKRSFTNAFSSNEQLLQALDTKYHALLAKSERRKQAREDRLRQDKEEIDSFMGTISALERRGGVSRSDKSGRGHGTLIDGLRRVYSTLVEALEAEKQKWKEQEEEEKKDLDAVLRSIRLFREQEEEEEEEEE